MLERAHPHGITADLDLGGVCVQRGEGRDLRKALKDVDAPKIRQHEGPIAGFQKCRDCSGVEQPAGGLDFAANSAKQQIEQPQRLGRHLRRALPVNVERNSLSAKPSMRLAASERRPSSRS
jgi:hypothetical protein